MNSDGNGSLGITVCTVNRCHTGKEWGGVLPPFISKNAQKNS